MHRHLFGHVDLAPNRAHVLDGTVPEAFAAEHAAEFDRWIAADGGLDLQLLGIGRNGHIGFNEPSDLPVGRGAPAAHPAGRPAPGDPRRRRPRLRRRRTRVIPAGADPGRRPDPGGPLDPRSSPSAPHKAEAVAAALTGPMTAAVPASLLQSVARPRHLDPRRGRRPAPAVTPRPVTEIRPARGRPGSTETPWAT